nr:10607_t:CDS:2 [Entrophospora candida]
MIRSIGLLGTDWLGDNRTILKAYYKRHSRPNLLINLILGFLSTIPEDIHSLQKASQVANIDPINNYKKLNKILCEWIAWLKKKNVEHYKAESLFASYSGGDAHKLEMQSFSRRLDGGLNLSLYTEKNNQMGMFKRNKYGKSTARKIPMPADQENGRYKPINDILKYISKRLKDATSQQNVWYKETRVGKRKLSRMMKSIAELTGLDLNDDRKLVNHSVRRTAIQILKDNDVLEDEIIKFSGRIPREGVRAYKNPNEQQLICI